MESSYVRGPCPNQHPLPIFGPSARTQFGSSRDLTVLQRLAEQLTRAGSHLDQGPKLLQTATWAWNLSTGELFWSRDVFGMLGFDPNATSRRYSAFLERVHPEDRSRADQVWTRVARQKEDYQLDYRFISPEGDIKYLHTEGHPVLNEAGEVVFFVGTAVDVTQQRLAQAALNKALEQVKAAEDELYTGNLALQTEFLQSSKHEEIVGSCAAWQNVLARVDKVAPTDLTVLITGETGTGKELVARAIHARSQRSGRTFVNVNCAALSSSSVGTELFGIETGTGALSSEELQPLSRCNIATGCTIVLDRIAELLPNCQTALLKLLEERKFEREAENRPIPFDVRWIAATDLDLHTEVAEGRFRKDLFYRLNVFPIELPPLRGRKEDIPLLVRHFVDRYAKNADKRIVAIDEATLELFASYPWPGNVRQLQNVIERSVIICEGETFVVDPNWLAKESSQLRPPVGSITQRLLEYEKQIIEAALAESKGRVAGRLGAAARLGMPQSTLDSRIKALKIDKHRFRSGELQLRFGPVATLKSS
jgi:PAS domain S-box-containing protein